jgi:ubiquinone/menaquinone biosynthesis C-methylase UbiE
MSVPSNTSSIRIHRDAAAWFTRIVVQPLSRLLRRIVRRVFHRNPAAVAFWVAESPVVFAAMATLSELRVFDVLKNGPQSAGDLARRVCADEDALARLLRAVSAVGLLNRRRDGWYELNPVARQFCSDSPNPVGAWSELFLQILPLLSRLPAAVRAGEPLMKHATGGTCWDYLATVPRGTELHDRAMNAWTEAVVDAIAKHCPLAQARTVVDVGGGRGALLAALLRSAPHLHGTVCDREHTREDALQRFQRQGLQDRATHTAGNFFEAVPAGADVYTLKHVLHDWDDDHVLQILRVIRRAIPPQGRLLIIEGAADHDLLPGASVRAVWDLTQWIATWGKERTLAEFQTLLEAAGFRLDGVRVTPTYDALVIEAVPV